ncbi:MAG: hypothetical protein AAB534_02010 [Patescibacteria group bacterium]
MKLWRCRSAGSAEMLKLMEEQPDLSIPGTIAFPGQVSTMVNGKRLPKLRWNQKEQKWDFHFGPGDWDWRSPSDSRE